MESNEEVVNARLYFLSTDDFDPRGGGRFAIRIPT